ncbi:EamA family transporter, partial [Streptomyces sp. NPDC001156]
RHAGRADGHEGGSDRAQRLTTHRRAPSTTLDQQQEERYRPALTVPAKRRARCTTTNKYMLVHTHTHSCTSETEQLPTLGLAVLGGVFIVFNWVLLFQAYENTSISVATVVYHTQPFYVVLLGALLFRERLTAAKCDVFAQCTECGRAYWKGAHHDQLEAIVERALAEHG